MTDFAMAVVRWQKKHGRHGLPWQQTDDPYRVWLSEIMLQQTQVAAVLPYYEGFLRRFPTLEALARARAESVLAAWSGLGYYARARNLHAAAKAMHKSGVPTDAAGWAALPGVGRSTAAAVAVFTRGERCAILDGNVKRVLARTHSFAKPIDSGEGLRGLWALAEGLLPSPRHIRPYTQGLMDIGATVCHRRRPRCGACPLADRCLAHQQRRTAAYPLRRAKKPKPERAAHYALVRGGGGKVLLQRQPPRGIWGGLWALPAAGGALRGQLAAPLRAAGQMAFTHEFTHYRLRAKVSVYECDAAPAVAAPLRWHRQWQKAALPSPMRRLLEEMGKG